MEKFNSKFEQIKNNLLIFLVFLASCREKLPDNQLYIVKPDLLAIDSIGMLLQEVGTYKKLSKDLIFEFTVKDKAVHSSVRGLEDEGYENVSYIVREDGGIELIDSEKYPMEKGGEPVSFENKFLLKKIEEEYYIISADFFPDLESVLDNRNISFTFDPETKILTGNIPENYRGSATRVIDETLRGIKSIYNITKNEPLDINTQ